MSIRKPFQRTTFGVLTALTLASCGIKFPDKPDGPPDLLKIDGLPGRWKATSVTDTIGGLERSCKNAVFDIQRTGEPNASENTFTFTERAFSCANETYVTRWQALILRERGGKLFNQGILVGEITENSLVVDLPLGGATLWTLSIGISGTTIKYHETITGRSKTTAKLEKLN